MGEAFDRTGAFLGAAQADSMSDVLKKLVQKHGDNIAEVRIRKFTDSPAQSEMPRYKSHKEVHALKIGGITFDAETARKEGRETDGSATILPELIGYAAFKVDSAYVRRHNPQVGGYFVVYEDGYQSFSPADAFESGYTRI